jgi:hypothetical protein
MSRLWLTIACVVILSGCAPHRSDLASSLVSNQNTSLVAWLQQHPAFRVASDDDCNCADDIKEMRESGAWGKPMPTFQPYSKIGDFNHDGFDDLAIIAIRKDDSSQRKFLIFNGPFSSQPRPPALSQDTYPAAALFYEPPEHPLIIGPFESEGCIITARNGRYILDCFEG